MLVVISMILCLLGMVMNFDSVINSDSGYYIFFSREGAYYYSLVWSITFLLLLLFMIRGIIKKNRKHVFWACLLVVIGMFACDIVYLFLTDFAECHV